MALPMPGDDTARYYDSHDGLRLFYRDYAPESAGGTVLCLPGLTRNSRDFDELAHRLRTARRVLAPDLRGRGYSDRDPDWRNYNGSTYLRDIRALLDSLAIERVTVIGTSLGGLIAMLMAADDPSRLSGVVLNDIGPEVAPEGLARIRSYTGRLPPVRDWDEAVRQTREVYGECWPGLTDAEWLQMAGRAYREGPDGGPQLDLDSGIGTAIREASPQARDSWQTFEALRDTPTLLIRGERSDILAEDTLHRMRERKPDLVTVTVRNRGHVPLLNEPECVAAIDDFLERL